MGLISLIGVRKPTFVVANTSEILRRKIYKQQVEPSGRLYIQWALASSPVQRRAFAKAFECSEGHGYPATDKPAVGACVTATPTKG